jgi:hypothetical protein
VPPAKPQATAESMFVLPGGLPSTQTTQQLRETELEVWICL